MRQYSHPSCLKTSSIQKLKIAQKTIFPVYCVLNRWGHSMVCKGEFLVNSAVSRIQNPSTRMIMYCLSIFTFTLDNIGLSLCTSLGSGKSRVWDKIWWIDNCWVDTRRLANTDHCCYNKPGWTKLYKWYWLCKLRFISYLSGVSIDCT